jgi:CheY-like chemotaxis protein
MLPDRPRCAVEDVERPRLEQMLVDLEPGIGLSAQVHRAGGAEGDADHGGSEHGGVAMPADRRTRRVPRNHDLLDRLARNGGCCSARADERLEELRRRLGREDLPSLIVVVPAVMDDGAACHDALHPDLLERERIDVSKQAGLVIDADEVRSIGESGGRVESAGRAARAGFHGCWRARRCKNCIRRIRLESPRILVVDDEPAIRALVAKIVARAGLPVDTASDGAEAIDRLESGLYRVCVVDLMMPRVDGFGVVEYVKNMSTPRPAVIVISAGDPTYLRKLDGSIVHSIVRKPFDIDVLGDLIVAAANAVQADQAEKDNDSDVLPFPAQKQS